MQRPIKNIKVTEIIQNEKFDIIYDTKYLSDDKIEVSIDPQTGSKTIRAVHLKVEEPRLPPAINPPDVNNNAIQDKLVYYFFYSNSNYLCVGFYVDNLILYSGLVDITIPVSFPDDMASTRIRGRYRNFSSISNVPIESSLDEDDLLYMSGIVFSLIRMILVYPRAHITEADISYAKMYNNYTMVNLPRLIFSPLSCSCTTFNNPMNAPIMSNYEVMKIIASVRSLRNSSYYANRDIISTRELIDKKTAVKMVTKILENSCKHIRSLYSDSYFSSLFRALLETHSVSDQRFRAFYIRASLFN